MKQQFIEMDSSSIRDRVNFAKPRTCTLFRLSRNKAFLLHLVQRLIDRA